MPVKKTHTSPALTGKKSSRITQAKSTATKPKTSKRAPKTPQPATLLVKRVPTRSITKKIKASVSVKKSTPVARKTTRRRQTDAEMEQKLSILLATKEKNAVPSEAVVPLTLEQSRFQKFRHGATDTLKLPTNMSIRSIKKAEVIRSLFVHDTVWAAERVAYVGSACLIIFGLFFSFTEENLLPQAQQAQVSSSLSGTGTISGVANTTTETVLKPTLEMSTAIPSEIVDDVQINFVAQYTSGAEVVITSFAGNGAIAQITPNPIGENIYRFTIPGKSLLPGEHRVTIRLRGGNGSAVVERNFSFVKPLPLVKEREVVQTATPTDAGAAATATTTTTQPDSANSVGDDIEIETETPRSAAEQIKESAAYTEDLQIILPQTSLTGITIIGFNAPEDTEVITLFTRNKSSLTPTRIGTASRSKIATHWQFVFDTRVRPDGEYELFAEAKIENGRVLRDSETILVINAILTDRSNLAPSIPNTITNTVTAVESSDEVVERPALPVPRLPREFAPVISSDGSVEVSTVSEVTTDSDKLVAVTSLTESILTDNRTEIENLYQRYSVALQSGDDMLVKAIEQDIAAARARLTTQLLTDNSTNYYADDVDRELHEQFETMKKRVIAFEEIRKSSSNEKSSIDSDNDGVSDFDEENLYFTDPNGADTDNDGVLDGIEIIRGFDPRNAAAEAIITFESPKESFGLVRSDVLAVTGVTPVLVTNEEGETAPVQAEIKGKGLPNSFVTIYIFSTPVIITVKTDDTGSFSYTFDKELENGEHEVYVAVTDNTGGIIAQSNPFRFIKEAQAFTPVNDNAPVSAQPVVSPAANQYNITVGLGILALGLVLLMLGVSLRGGRTETIIDAPAA